MSFREPFSQSIFKYLCFSLFAHLVLAAVFFSGVYYLGGKFFAGGGHAGSAGGGQAPYQVELRGRNPFFARPAPVGYRKVPAIAAKTSAPAAPVSATGDGEGMGNGQGSGVGNGTGSGAGTGEGLGLNDPNYQLIRQKLERAKIYPALAARKGMTGVARVQFRVGLNGEPLDLALTETSGFALLDDATLKTVARAAPFPHVEGMLTFPLRYELVASARN